MQQLPSVQWQSAYELIEPHISADSIHVYNFASPLPIDVRYLTFSGQPNIRMNRHEYFELLYGLSGSVVYQVQGRTYPLNSGDLFVIGNSLMHRMICYPDGGFRAIALYFDPKMFRGSDLEYLMPFQFQGSGFPHVIGSSTGVPGQILGLIQQIAANSSMQSRLEALASETCLKMILIHLADHYSKLIGNGVALLQQEQKLARLRPLFAHIDSCYSTPITVEDAARLLHMSKSSFTRFFKQTTGESFINYLNQFRISCAQNLLASTDKSIAEVSQETGFCDQSYFGLVFRKLTGQTARAYKSNLLGQASRCSGADSVDIKSDSDLPIRSSFC